jgi:hypothetical protein
MLNRAIEFRLSGRHPRRAVRQPCADGPDTVPPPPCRPSPGRLVASHCRTVWEP